jgi:hypothetical protein
MRFKNIELLYNPVKPGYVPSTGLAADNCASIGYVKSHAGMLWKEPVKAASTPATDDPTLSLRDVLSGSPVNYDGGSWRVFGYPASAAGFGLSTFNRFFDNVSLAVDDRVLIHDLADKISNGIYVVGDIMADFGSGLEAAVGFKRAGDLDNGSFIGYYTILVPVLMGPTYGSGSFVLRTLEEPDAPDPVGVVSLVFTYQKGAAEQLNWAKIWRGQVTFVDGTTTYSLNHNLALPANAGVVSVYKTETGISELVESQVVLMTANIAQVTITPSVFVPDGTNFDCVVAG